MSDIADRLATLTQPAPTAVAPSVLLTTGLADGIVERSTPAGTLQVAFNIHGVSASTLSPDAEQFATGVTRRFGRAAYLVSSMPRALATQLDRALASGRVGSLPLDLRSVSPFQKSVLEVVAKIPPGQVRPYRWVAAEAENPGASRAVGSTMARNPIPVLIPCHRVVKSDGRLGNYLFGVEAKRALLEAEGMDTESAEANAGHGRLLLGSNTTNIVCHPTCSHARRITDRHQRWFRSMSEATQAGFRACRDCRPVG